MDDRPAQRDEDRVDAAERPRPVESPAAAAPDAVETDGASVEQAGAPATPSPDRMTRPDGDERSVAPASSDEGGQAAAQPTSSTGMSPSPDGVCSSGPASASGDDGLQGAPVEPGAPANDSIVGDRQHPAPTAAGRTGPTTVAEQEPSAPSTGLAAVDASLARLAGLSSVPVADHVGRYEDVHRSLSDSLSGLDREPAQDADGG